MRVTDLPISDKLRNLRQGHLNCLIRVSGVVTRRSGVYPQMISVAFDCGNCGLVIGPFRNDGNVEIKPTTCTSCQSTGPFKINPAKTEYGNYQKITLQESPGSVPPGRMPRYKEVVLLGDLIDVARPGEEIEVTGIYLHQQSNIITDKKSGSPVFSTIIEANCIVKKGGTSSSDITEEDKRIIIRLSKDPQVSCLY